MTLSILKFQSVSTVRREDGASSRAVVEVSGSCPQDDKPFIVFLAETLIQGLEQLSLREVWKPVE